MKNPKVVIIIINYNGLADTVECLNSLKKIEYSNFNILVVDNNSQNDEAQALEDGYENFIRVIRSERNLGFTGGNNLGIKKARALEYDYLLLLNNDTVVDPNFLNCMIGLAKNNPKVGLMGSQINYYDSNEIYALGGGRANFFLDRFSYFGRGKRSDNKKNFKLGYVSGCCCLIRKEIIEKVGNFDERFFLYNEEVDLCLRARKQGFTLGWCPTSIIYHKSAQSTKYLSRNYMYYMIRNKLLLAKKHAHWYELMSFVPVFLIKEIIGYTALLAIRGKWQSIDVIVSAVHDFIINKFGEKLIKGNR